MRGFAPLICYENLMGVVKNDWTKIATHPKLQHNNTKLWYSVMMYHFLQQAGQETQYKIWWFVDDLIIIYIVFVNLTLKMYIFLSLE